MTTRTYGTRWLAIGDGGAKETLQYMAQLVHQAAADAEFVWWARGVINNCLPRDDACCAMTIRAFVDHSVWFLRDPLGVENITPPLEHMRRLMQAPGSHVRGDCDDAATLSAALGLAAGMPAQFTVLAFVPDDAPPGVHYDQRNAPYEHVFASLWSTNENGWREMDTTRPHVDLPIRVVRSLNWQV